MYVCVCNAIKDDHVKEALEDGAETVGQVFKKNGCKPECAKCFGCVRKIIDQSCNAECQKTETTLIDPDLIAAE